ncbi:UBA/THIF-type NAD/FAD binding protein [Isosphaera pallida ATCC 43644]|uniref:UBA/THIF-type NAD/FAD binding protein n=1 Tax=Isosphaera pallida (strain ATCC 43644 / DSM 9630 / IS1B) TaxID=575540 RepID=E8QWN5_ISOPI|nr:ThiF family adenylyltransferase [Isosphaera pallida]ADV61927.1 UBA/THIF-type NAD/FAD binding protein [Isosphaera pallida ATCC 43644]
MKIPGDFPSDSSPRNAEDLQFLEEPTDPDRPVLDGLATPVGDDEPLRIDDEDRYGRLRLIPWWRQERLAASKVMVVGAGALGNEVVKNLGLVGVGTIVVIDFDRVEPTNLSRSLMFRREDAGRPKAEVLVERLAQLNPEVRGHAIAGDVIHDVGLGLFAEMDVILGCLDNREARLWVNRQARRAGVPWIDAGIQEMHGAIKLFTDPNAACYECGLTDADYRALNTRYSCPLLSRDDLQRGKVPTSPTIAAIIAALQAQETLKLLHGLPVAHGCVLVFNGVGNLMFQSRLPVNPHCLGHEDRLSWIPLALSHNAAVSDLFAHLRRLEGSRFDPGSDDPTSQALTLVLERELVTTIDFGTNRPPRRVMKPRDRVGLSEAIDPRDGSTGRPITLDRVREGSLEANWALAELGIPARDVVWVERSDGAGAWFLLSDDQPVLETHRAGDPRR